MNKELNPEQLDNFENLMLEGDKMMQEAEVTVDGYLIPNSRKGIKWNPAVDSQGNVIFECYMLPLNFIKIVPREANEYISVNRWIVEVLGEDIGFSRVELPTLDAMTDDNRIALVKLYRAKMEPKKLDGVNG